MLSSAALTAARRVLTSTGAAAPLRQSVAVAARALVLRPAAPSLRLISTSAPLRAAAAKATKAKSTKSSTKKPASKKSAKPKAKKPVKKKAIKKKVAVKKPKKAPKKKALTDEQKDKLEIKRLRQMALLKGPTLLPETAWNVFIVDNVRAGEGSLVEKVKALAISFKNLPETERERMAAVGHSNKIANQAAKKKWIESYPPEAIHAANLARRRLARKTDKSRTYLIHDERIPQRTGSGFTFFIKEHFSENEGPPKDAMRNLSERWKTLSNEEKAPYLKKAADIAEVSGAQLKELREKGAKYWKEKLASAKA